MRKGRLGLWWLSLLGLLLTLALGRVSWAEDPTPSASVPSVTLSSAAVVKLRDRQVFELRLGRGGISAAERAQQATRALEPLVSEKKDPEIRVVDDHDVAVIYADQTPIIQLTTEDAQAAGFPSLNVHAAAVAARIRNELTEERQRHQAAHGVFSVSLLVFSGLIIFLLFRKLDELTERVRERLQNQQEDALRFRLGGIDVLSPAVLLGTLHVSLTAGRVLIRVALGYGWLVFALSQFELTRGHTDRLTNALVTPVTDLFQRMFSTTPLVVVLVVVVFVLLVFLRFIRVLFQGYAEGTNQSQLVSPDLAAPSGTLTQIGVVVLVLVAILPLVTGHEQGVTGRLGGVALAALGLGMTPLLAAATVGTLQVFGRRLHPGDQLRMGKVSGKIKEVNLLEMLVEQENGEVARIPHLLGLFQTMHIQRTKMIEVFLSVAPEVSPQQAYDALINASAQKGKAVITLERVDREGSLFCIRLVPERELSTSELLLQMATALQQQKIPLGRLLSAGEAP